MYTITYISPALTERGKEAFELDVRGRMMLVPLGDVENGATRNLVDMMGRSILRVT